MATTNLTSLKANALTNVVTTIISTANIVSSVVPKISSITYPSDDTAAIPAGGQTITLTGSGFNAGASVLIDGTYASVVTVVSSTTITFTAPAKAAGTYVLYVINTDGGTAISVPGISYSGTPTWSTASGSIATLYETTAISNTVTSTGDAPITYSLYSGTLPPGSSLNTSTGLISGTSQATASSTTYNFTIRASDAQNQDTDRAFSITINPDVVTWSTPASNETYNVSKDSAIANVAMSASSAAGGSITYTADTLPTGLSITGANITGTPTVVDSTSTTLTATSTTTRTATRTINWVVSVASDTYFKNVTLLLNGETTVTPFNSDASTNNLALTIAGDTKPNKFNPYTPGYYSNSFDGTGDYLTVPDNTALESFTDFTIEFWVYFNSVAGSQVIVDKGWNGSAFSPYLIFLSGGSLVAYASAGGGSWDVLSGSSFGTPSVNTWYHIALTRSGSSIRLFRDGVVITTVTNSSTLMNSTSALGIGGSPSAGANPFNGYISNLRIVKGTAVYTSNFTPSTTPLTAIANTSLLTLQYNGDVTNKGIIDNSNFNNIITRAGNASQGSFSPYSVTGWSNYFDGTGDYLTVPNNTALQFGTGDFTVELWWYPTSVASDQGFLGGEYDFAWRTSTGLNIGRINIAWDNTFSFTPTVNQWYHIAYSRSGTSLKVFVNGSQVGSTATNSISYVPGSGGAVIGGSTTADRLLTGYISNFRLVKGTAVYTSNFTPPTTPLTPIANTSLLTCQSNRFIDNSINNFTLTRAGDTSVQAFGPFGSVPEAVPISYSNSFNGTSDYLNISSNAAFGLGTDAYTIEGWFYPTTTTTEINIAWRIGAINGSNSISGGVAGNSIQFRHTGTTTATSATISILNTWNHVAWVRNSGTVKVYLNGTEVISTSASTSVSTSDCTIGYESTTFRFNGSISNFRVVKGTAVYTSAFTPSTTPLTAIANTSLLTCQSTTMIDNSTNAFTITATGDTKPRPFNPFGYTAQSATSYTPSLHGGSAYFDGTGDYLVCPAASNISGTGYSWTVQGWFYALNITGGILDGWNGGAGTSLLVRLSAGELQCYVTGNSNTTATGIGTNRWYHFALVKDVNNSNTIQLYLNGVKVGTPIANYTTSITSNILGVGGNTSTGGEGFIGYISDIQIIKGTAVYTSNFLPPAQALTAITKTSLLLNFNSGGIIDQHGTNVLETVGNARLSTAVKKYNNASMYFDGSSVLKVTGTHLLTPTNFRFPMAGEIYTIEGWFYFVTLNSPRSHLIGCYGTAESGWTIDVDTSGNFFFSSGGAGTTLTMQSPITTGTWIHLAFVNTGSIIDVYKNGVKNVSSQANYTPGISTIPLHIGRRGFSTGDLPSTVYIDDLRITKGYARYTANFTPPTALTTR